jgi:SagB-type dehydrogenase family enzyme
VSHETGVRLRAASRGDRVRKKPEGVRYRRSPFLVSYWRGDQLVFENFFTRRRVFASPLTTTILHYFDRARSLRSLYLTFQEYSPASLDKAVRDLARHSLLQRNGEKQPAGERELLAWSEWNPAAGFFHFSTKDLPFEKDAAKEFRGLVRLAKSKPIPRPVKRYPQAQQVSLPTPESNSAFARVLLERRTWRQFSKRPVSLLLLSNLLGLTWGVRQWIELPQIGSVAAKTSPSGGALHPIEAYVLARNVEGLRAGIYHYDAAGHRLELLRRSASSRQITGYLANQYWYKGAGFVVFMTAVFGRTRWKYDYARAYRAVLIEAGHLCQTFCLTATWLGVAPFCTMAFADSKIEKVLGLDGIQESMLYVAGAGLRPENDQRAHLLSGAEIGKLEL